MRGLAESGDRVRMPRKLAWIVLGASLVVAGTALIGVPWRMSYENALALRDGFWATAVRPLSRPVHTDEVVPGSTRTVHDALFSTGDFAFCPDERGVVAPTGGPPCRKNPAKTEAWLRALLRLSRAERFETGQRWLVGLRLSDPRQAPSLVEGDWVKWTPELAAAPRVVERALDEARADTTLELCVDAFALHRDIALDGRIGGMQQAWELTSALLPTCERALSEASPDRAATARRQLVAIAAVADPATVVVFESASTRELIRYAGRVRAAGLSWPISIAEYDDGSGGPESLTIVQWVRQAPSWARWQVWRIIHEPAFANDHREHHQKVLLLAALAPRPDSAEFRALADELYKEWPGTGPRFDEVLLRDRARRAALQRLAGPR